MNNVNNSLPAIQTRKQDSQEDIVVYDYFTSQVLNDEIVLRDDTKKPPAEWGFVDKLWATWGVIVGSDYETAVNKITNAINHNDKGFLGLVSGNLSYETTATVLNTYANLNLQGKIPAFEVEKLKKEDLKKIATYVGTIASISEGNEYPYRILSQLYWYAKDGTIQRDILLRPVNYKNNKQMQILAEALAGASSQGSDKNFWGGIGLPKWTGWVVGGVVVVGVLGYGVSQAVKVKSMLSDGREDCNCGCQEEKLLQENNESPINNT